MLCCQAGVNTGTRGPCHTNGPQEKLNPKLHDCAHEMVLLWFYVCGPVPQCHYSLLFSCFIPSWKNIHVFSFSKYELTLDAPLACLINH